MGFSNNQCLNYSVFTVPGKLEAFVYCKTLSVVGWYSVIVKHTHSWFYLLPVVCYQHNFLPESKGISFCFVYMI